MPNAEVVPQNSSAQTDGSTAETAGPSTVWLGAGFLLAGLGTVLLGPILPVVSARWQLTDAAAGSLFFAKFLGAFAGGATAPTRLRFGILSATILTALGLTGFAFSIGLWTGALALAILGFGLGQLIASSNILAGRRYTAHPGSALSTFNFFWSLGAVGTGLLTAWLLPRFRLSSLLISTSVVFLLVGLGGASNWLFRPAPEPTQAVIDPRKLPTGTFLFFAALLLLYGGLETSLSSWLPTFELRYQSGQPLLGGQSAIVLLWLSITAGRALAAAILRRWPETVVLRISLACSVVLILTLAGIRSTATLSAICILLGLSLAPWFPAAFGLLLRRKSTSREAGLVLATSGIGAAIFPWLTGIVSTHVNSLRIGMAVPATLAVLLLLAAFLPARADVGPAT